MTIRKDAEEDAYRCERENGSVSAAIPLSVVPRCIRCSDPSPLVGERSTATAGVVTSVSATDAAAAAAATAAAYNVVARQNFLQVGFAHLLLKHR